MTQKVTTFQNKIKFNVIDEVIRNEHLELFPSLLGLIAENVCNFKNVFIHTFELGNEIF